MINIERVSYQYAAGFWMKKTPVLNSVSLSVPKGSTFVLLGPNGAGKTTLIHLVAGLRHATAGQITIAGGNPRDVQTKRKIGFLPERPYFYDFLTGEQLLKFFGSLSQMPHALLNERIEAVLKLTRMDGARKKELRGYSKGMLQRIGIAQALLHDPDLLIFDEPFSGLDPAGQKMVMDLIVELRNKGKTVFLTSHWLQPLRLFCTHFAAIQKGKIVESGELSASQTGPDLEKFFVELE